MARKLVSYRLADDLQEALKERASTEGISATELVNRLLRQGLSDHDDEAPTEFRLSHLEQVLHQLEKRVDGVTDLGNSTQSSPMISRQLMEVEIRLRELTAGVEEGCRNLRQLNRVVGAVLPRRLGSKPEHIDHQLDSSGLDSYLDQASPDDVARFFRDIGVKRLKANPE
ncbi:MAG: hypothetical protein HC922_04065 [Leptolyngbyaceae cyanobacterium SM2_3_12]|nr:hypothetical protein [Leptolyngbyaceae cyanobacterium SM2_3_12]